MLDTGKDAGWFESPVIVVQALIAAIGFVVWVIWEITAEHPIVDLSLFKNRNFSIATTVLCVNYALFFATSMLLPLWLQTQMGYLATWAGLVVAPSGMVAVLMTPFVTKFASRVDLRIVASFSLIMFSASTFMRSQYGPDASFEELVIPSLVAGFGMATFFMSVITLCLNGIPPSQVPQATSLTNFARITAGSFAASVVTTIWDNQSTLHQTRLAEVTARSTDQRWYEAMGKLQEQGATVAQSAAALGGQVIHQAAFLGAMDLFRMCAIGSAVLLPLVWFTKRTMLAGGGDSSGGAH